MDDENNNSYANNLVSKLMANLGPEELAELEADANSIISDAESLDSADAPNPAIDLGGFEECPGERTAVVFETEPKPRKVPTRKPGRPRSTEVRFTNPRIPASERVAIEHIDAGIPPNAYVVFGYVNDEGRDVHLTERLVKEVTREPTVAAYAEKFICPKYRRWGQVDIWIKSSTGTHKRGSVFVERPIDALPEEDEMGDSMELLKSFMEEQRRMQSRTEEKEKSTRDELFQLMKTFGVNSNSGSGPDGMGDVLRKMFEFTMMEKMMEKFGTSGSNGGPIVQMISKMADMVKEVGEKIDKQDQRIGRIEMERHTDSARNLPIFPPAPSEPSVTMKDIFELIRGMRSEMTAQQPSIKELIDALAVIKKDDAGPNQAALISAIEGAYKQNLEVMRSASERTDRLMERLAERGNDGGLEGAVNLVKRVREVADEFAPPQPPSGGIAEMIKTAINAIPQVFKQIQDMKVEAPKMIGGANEITTTTVKEVIKDLPNHSDDEIPEIIGEVVNGIINSESYGPQMKEQLSAASPERQSQEIFSILDTLLSGHVDSGDLTGSEKSRILLTVKQRGLRLQL
mgnify:CR=1 FL=1